MRLIFFLSGSLLLLTCLSFHGPELPKDVERKLRRDAARLALRVEVGNEDPRFAPIKIPEDRTASLFRALAAVYTSGPQGESLSKCNIHTFPNPSIDRITVIYEKDAPWAASFQQGMTETSYPKLQTLIQRNGLIVEKQVQWTESHDALTLRAREAINMAALKEAFLDIPGVVETDLGIPKILGNDIQAIRTKQGWSLQYILRFGAWASGTGQSHIWRFDVDDAGKVTPKGDSGDPVPSWMKCLREEQSLASGRF